MQHRTVSILHFFATHNERLLYQINNKLITDYHPIYCDQNTAKTSIVHTINNWHASCTRNFKNPLASTYSSFTKIPEQVTNFKTNRISQIKFWSRKANSKGYFSQYALPTQKAETQEHATFGQYVCNNTKALTKVTKDHQKKPKSLLATIIFNRLTVTINDGSPFKNRVHSWYELHPSLYRLTIQAFVQC